MTPGLPDGIGAAHGLSPQELALFDIRTVFDPDSTAMQTLRSVLGAETDGSGVAWIAMPSATGNLMIEYVHGAATPLLDRLLIRHGGGLTGKVYSSGQVDWVEHYATATSITHEFDGVISAERVVKMLAAPVRVDDGVDGVLTLASRREGAFGDVAIERIEGLARRVGLALQIARHSRLHAEAAAAAERTRLSEELHDGVGALLFTIGSRAERLRKRAGDDGGLSTEIAALQCDLERASRSMRDLLSDWRASGESDLHAEIVADAREFEARSGVRCTVVFLGGDVHLDASTSEALKRFAREALLNVEKHARAGAVSVTVTSLVTMTSVAVADDGMGLHPSEETGFGLAAARERVQRLGGTVSVVDDGDGRGVVARAWIPR